MVQERCRTATSACPAPGTGHWQAYRSGAMRFTAGLHLRGGQQASDMSGLHGLFMNSAGSQSAASFPSGMPLPAGSGAGAASSPAAGAGASASAWRACRGGRGAAGACVSGWRVALAAKWQGQPDHPARARLTWVATRSEASMSARQQRAEARM